MLYQLSYARVVVAYCSTVSLSLATADTYAAMPFALDPCRPCRPSRFIPPNRTIPHRFAPYLLGILRWALSGLDRA